MNNISTGRVSGDNPESYFRICILGKKYETQKISSKTPIFIKKNEESYGDRDMLMKVNAFISNVFESTSNNIIHMVQSAKESFSAESVNKLILEDIYTRIIFNYRMDFESIAKISGSESDHSLSVLLRAGVFAYYSNIMHNNSNIAFVTDIGWGCMIRTGQSLLANALQIIHQGRDFRLKFLDTASANNELSENCQYEKENYINWFKDEFKHPFSIQNFVKSGYELSNKKPGEWFGPSTAARSIQDLVHSFPECGIDRCYISIDSGTVYSDEIDKIYLDGDDKKVLILLCVRLGISELNEYYWDDLRFLLEMDGNTCGISGGKPSSSYYFFGYENDTLLYLDPHDPKPYTGDSIEFIKSTHSMNYKKLPLSQVDPSMMFGFVLKNKTDWDNFQKSINFMNSGRGSRIVQLVENSSQNLHDIGDENTTRLLSNGSGVSVEHSIDSRSNDTHGTDVNNIYSTGSAGFETENEEDYIDIGKMLMNTSLSSIPQEPEEPDEYQDVRCKQQNILTLKNDSDDVDGEEKVLCAQSVVSVENEDKQ